jgi:hypothetical protein
MDRVGVQRRRRRRVGDPTDLEEAARVAWVPLSSVLELVHRGELLGSGSLVGLLYFLAQKSAQLET